MIIPNKTKEYLITTDIKYISNKEEVPQEYVAQMLELGEIVILKNINRDIDPCALGTGLRTKINANIGSSPDSSDMKVELEKLSVLIEAGADTVMDLSIGGDIQNFRRTILQASSIPFGTVPIYEAAVDMLNNKKNITDMSIDDFLNVVQRKAEDGVDFMTIHAGVTRESLESLYSQKRIIGITSRGGSILAEWISKNNKENPLYQHYNDILDILKQYNVVISLGDGLRPGCINDASDRGQTHEMILLGTLARRAKERGVQVIIEGPGHVPLDIIADNVRLAKHLCDNAPYYVLGPLVTDVAPGYDHITAAIGGAIAAANGADFLCYVTPAEHLRLPTIADVHEGVIASRIAAHAADLVKMRDKSKKWDDNMSNARMHRDWEKMHSYSIDSAKARKLRNEIPSDDDQCSMCGKFCAIKNKEF